VTRQWLADPKDMCSRHVMGEHAETHSLMDKMTKGDNLEGLIERSAFFGADFVKARHDLLMPYIPGHGSEMTVTDELRVSYPLLNPGIEDIKKSLYDLIVGCLECARNHASLFQKV
jgi:hypothetical protein